MMSKQRLARLFHNKCAAKSYCEVEDQHEPDGKQAVV